MPKQVFIFCTQKNIFYFSSAKMGFFMKHLPACQVGARVGPACQGAGVGPACLVGGGGGTRMFGGSWRVGSFGLVKKSIWSFCQWVPAVSEFKTISE